MTTTTAPLHAAAASPPAKKGDSSRFYRPELDAIRFFLFLGVLFHHAVDNAGTQGWARHPRVASMVDAVHDASGFALSFFFFLSAYLITSLLQIEKQRTGTVDLKRFYLRRMLRLWPLYVSYVALITGLQFVFADLPVGPGAFASLLLFAGNWYLMLPGSLLCMVLVHLWSISVEEQFYVLFPFLARRFSMRRMQQGCIALCGVALATTWGLVHSGIGGMNLWVNSVVQSIFFASGALFALRSTLEVHQKSAVRAFGGIGSGLLFWLVAERGGLTNLHHTLHPWSATLAFATADVGCALVLWGTLRMPASLVPRPMVYLGRIAYGLYVFHEFIIYLVRTYFAPHTTMPGLSLLVELLLTIAVAMLSYECFEKPFLKLKHRFELVHSRAA